MEFERQFVMVDAYIGNDGKLMKWELHEFYNLKESNEQYLPELKKQIDRILNYMNDWNPGKLMGKDVNSTICLDIDLDKER